MDQTDVNAIISRYNQNKATEEERAMLETWYNTQSMSHTGPLPDVDYLSTRNAIWAGISPSLLKPKLKLYRNARYLSAAALIFILFSVGLLYFISDHQIDSVVRPGSSKASLTLSDGTSIPLDQINITDTLNDAHIPIVLGSDGTIRYPASGGGDLNAFNTIATPKGGEHKLVLSDGTRVWINAASRLRFPVTFSKGNRVVELSGEAYFEVTHDKARPFIVICKGRQRVEVLGTQFNISAYPEDIISTTTLIQGLVKVSRGITQGNSVILHPGHQTNISPEGISVAKADTEHAISWKNGKFNFNEDNLESIMAKIARWYNVEVTFRSNHLRKETYVGVIDRSSELKDLLHMLERVGNARFEVQGNQILISAKE
jgi:ferric-dicitrate binding protein FerR (iron transport regulator)